MKKLVTWVAVVGLALVGGTALAGEAKVMRLSGEAFIANADGIQRVKPGMTCGTGDMVMTREGCQLDLSVNGQAGCRMLPNTTAAIASTKSDGMKILVAEGNVVLNIKKLEAGQKFTVDTPTAVAAVRGTQFWGRVTDSQAGSTVTTFAVREGSVEILSKSSNQRVTINAGQAVDLTADATQTALRPALKEEMDAMAVADDIAITA